MLDSRLAKREPLRQALIAAAHAGPGSTNGFPYPMAVWRNSSASMDKSLQGLRSLEKRFFFPRTFTRREPSEPSACI